MPDDSEVVPVAAVIPVVNQRRWERVLLVVTAFLLVVLLVVVTALEIQVQSRNQDIRRVEHVAATARDASQRAEKAVNDAVTAAQSAGPTGKQVVDALQTIQDIENQMQVLLGRTTPTAP